MVLNYSIIILSFQNNVKMMLKRHLNDITWSKTRHFGHNSVQKKIRFGDESNLSVRFSPDCCPIIRNNPEYFLIIFFQSNDSPKLSWYYKCTWSLPRTSWHWKWWKYHLAPKPLLYFLCNIFEHRYKKSENVSFLRKQNVNKDN